MAYTWDDYWIDRALQHEDKLIVRLSVEQRLKGASVEERLKGLSEEEIEAYLNKFRKRKPKSKNKKQLFI